MQTNGTKAVKSNPDACPIFPTHNWSSKTDFTKKETEAPDDQIEARTNDKIRVLSLEGDRVQMPPDMTGDTSPSHL